MVRIRTPDCLEWHGFEADLKQGRYRAGIGTVLRCEAEKPLCFEELQPEKTTHLRKATPGESGQAFVVAVREALRAGFLMGGSALGFAAFRAGSSSTFRSAPASISFFTSPTKPAGSRRS